MILTAPGSKSMTQRALILGALSQTTCRVSRPLACDDSRYLTDLLRALGVSVEWQDGEVVIAPPRDLRAPVAPVFCGNAGTAIRFGACLSLLAAGTLHLDGDAHMRKRPIGPLGDALAASNVEVTYLGDPGCPPLLLRRRGPTPPQITVDSTLSSQYASGLMLVAPRLPGGLELDLGGDVVSKPYLVMTEAMMRAAGATLERLDARRLAIAPGAYRAERLEVEPDWSGAAFLLAAGFVTGRDVTVAGLLPPEQSLQGDAVFLHQLAALRAPE
ncbi:MAG: hypothetical protein KC731_19055, partial [Myxococcales bacterium]|nr:hypothetical protein [Myxococcales bacterium]